jgi:hypothetical protein
MSDIKINIIGEFKKKAFVDADKATINLSNNFDRLRRSALRTFTAIAGVTALKRSVKAFAENEAAINNLTKSLDNLGFRFEAPGLVSYLENLEKTTAVVKEDLFPAYRNLANATLDVEEAQKLLNVALDISAGTGVQLSSVTTALTRAYNGNFASLGKIQQAYTTAELKAMGFSQSVQVLQDQFTGQAAASADTYQAKITRLNIAMGDAAEAIGEGVVDALEALGGGNFDKGLDLIAKAGEGVGDAFRFAATGVAYFNKFWKQGLFATKDQLAEFRRDMDGMFREDPAKIRTAARERAKGLAAERTQTEKIRKSREAAAKLAEKDKKNQLALNRARSVFDLEKIQIEAALKGKITEEERIRLQLMKAIANENATAAEDLTKKLKEVQEENAKIAKQLTEFPKASDPFAHWTTTLTGVMAQLTAIAQKKIVVDFLANFTGSTLTSAASTIAGVTGSTSTAAAAVAAAASPASTAAAAAAQGNIDELVGDATAAKAEAEKAAAEAAKAAADAAAALAAAKSEEEKRAAEAGLAAAAAAAAAAKAIEESAAALEAAAAAAAAAEAERLAAEAANVAELLAAEAAAAAAAAALADANLMFDASIIGAGAAGVPSVEIVVNVAGNVTAEQDLAETIYDQFIDFQKSGKGLLFSSTVI